MLRAGPGSPPGPAPGRLPRRAGHLATVPASRGGGSWLVVAAPVRYQARRIPFTYGSGGFSLLVTGPARAGVAGVLVAGVSLDPVTRAGHQLTGTMTAVSAGLVLAVAAAGLAALRALTGRAGRAAAAAAAAAQQATARLAGDVADTCGRLQRPLGVISGAAEYYRQRGPLRAPEADRLMRRIAEEAARSQALLEDRADHRPDAPAHGPG